MDTGWLSPTAGAETQWDGDGPAWSDTGNVLANDNNVAACTTAVTGSRFVVGKGFGANVPVDARVTGVEIRARASRGLGLASIRKYGVGNDGGVIGSLASNAVSIAGTETVYTMGSPIQMFGAVLTPAIVNAADFAAGLNVIANSGTPDVSVDQIELRVHYQPRSGLALLGVG